MHTIDRKRWFCIPPGTPRGATGDGAASARAPSAPTVPRKRTGSRRRPHAPHGFSPRRQRARTLRRPARARRRETFSVAGSGQSLAHARRVSTPASRCTAPMPKPRTRPARIPAGRFMGGSIQADGPENNARSLSPRGGPVREEGGLAGENPASRAAGTGKPTPDARNRYLLPFCGFGDILPPNLEPNRVRGLPILF